MDDDIVKFGNDKSNLLYVLGPICLTVGEFWNVLQVLFDYT